MLRHSYGSIILEAAESVATLAPWLGHLSPIEQPQSSETLTLT